MRLIKIVGLPIILFGLIMDKAQGQMHSSDTDHSDHSITILAEDYAFQAPDEIPSGWTTIEFTMKLPPGTYVMECYVKTEDGELHAMEGMVRELIVTEERSEALRPKADIDITLSNYEMDIEGELTPGQHTVAVHFEEGHYHNVHVARLGAEGSVQDVLHWLPWLEREGLWPPAPATLLGGKNILPEGETGYFTVDLEPGRYLFVSEITGHLGVMREVVVK